jgi:hypothetical protein
MVSALRQRILVQPLVLALWIGCAAAQTMPPTVKLAWPPAVNPGTSFDLVVEGRNLGGASRILFVGQGVEGKVESVTELSRGMKPSGRGSVEAPIEDPSTENRVLVQVRVSADAPLGRRPFRLLTPLGTSNLGGFDVVELPVAAGAKSGQKISLPAAVNGRIESADAVNLYSFDGKGGQPVVFEVVARGLDSKLESVLRLLDADGRVIARSSDFSRADAAILTTIPADGKYALEVRDLNGEGGKDYFYRLNAYVGTTVAFGPQAQLARPAQGYGAADPSVSGLLPANPPGGRLPILVSVKGAVLEADGDLLHFSAHKGQQLIIDTQASRTGSPLDSTIEVLDYERRPVIAATARAVSVTELGSSMGARGASAAVVSTGGFRANDYVWVGNELLRVAAIPEGQNPSLAFANAGGSRVGFMNTTPMQHGPNEKVYRVDLFPAGEKPQPRGLPLFPVYYANDDGGPEYGKDSRIDFVAPADGDYWVRIRDARGEHGPDYSYRLTIRGPAPGFALAFSPANPNVPRGGRVPITVLAQRVDGFDGTIDVAIAGLPRGLRATTGRIAPGQIMTTLTLEATADAGDPRPFRVVGTSGPQSVFAEPREAVGGNIAADVDLSPLSLVSMATPPDITVTVEPATLALKPGATVRATLRIHREAGFKARVPLTIANLPPGVSVKDIGLNGILINEDETSRAIEIQADPSAPAIEQSIYAIATVETNSPIPQRQASPPVSLRVLAGSDNTGIASLR